MNRFVHPATAFIQKQDTQRVLVKDLSRAERAAFDQYYSEEGGCGIPSPFSCVQKGEFVLTDAVKRAIILSMSEYWDVEDDEALQLFDANFTFRTIDYVPPFSDSWPVILNHPDLAPEFGFFADGYQRFVHYWLAGEPSTLDGRLIPFLIID